MLKKMIVMGTTVFLLFEVLYFNSNLTAKDMKQSDDGVRVYELALNSQKDDFLNQYGDIVLEDQDQSLLVLTNSQVIREIEEKYQITIVK